LNYNNHNNAFELTEKEEMEIEKYEALEKKKYQALGGAMEKLDALAKKMGGQTVSPLKAYLDGSITAGFRLNIETAFRFNVEKLMAYLEAIDEEEEEPSAVEEGADNINAVDTAKE
jgi:hypothetical protein